VPTLGDIATMVRLNLGITQTTLSDAQIVKIYNAHKDSCLAGYEFWFTRRIVDIPIKAGAVRFPYPERFMSLVKAMRLDDGESAATGDLKGINEREAARLGIVTTGKPVALIPDAGGYQLQDIPEEDFTLRMTYRAAPETAAGMESDSYLTNHAASCLEAFLTYKCAPKVGGMMGEAAYHREEYQIELNKLLDDNNLHENPEAELQGRFDALEAGIGNDGGDL
jgi:hypothetical protein